MKLDYAATYNCTTLEGKFLAIGSRYSYYTGGYEFNYVTIDPEEVLLSMGGSGVEEALPGSVMEDIQGMMMPYGLYVNPYTGYIYGTDAASFASSGMLYQWSPEGQLLGKHKVYINPAHFLALPPDGHFTGMSQLQTSNFKPQTSNTYDLQGRQAKPTKGGIYVSKGRKYISR